MKVIKDLRLEMGNYVIVALAISLITLFITLIGQKFLPPQIPLFYGQPEGEEQLASSFALFLPGAFALLLLFINVGLSVLIKDDFIKKFLVLASLVVSVFAAVTTLKIIFLVGSF
jgi:hypothetical protein